MGSSTSCKTASTRRIYVNSNQTQDSSLDISIRNSSFPSNSNLFSFPMTAIEAHKLWLRRLASLLDPAQTSLSSKFEL